MIKFSVKRPFTVLVAVLMIVILGYVSVQSIPTDLLPSVSLPYMVVITPYPGASPERVESQVAAPMERALGTVTGVKNVMSTCSGSYCVTQLEFEDGTDMESATVKVSGAVNQVKQQLPDGVQTPSIMEISMDMIATMYIAVSREGYDIFELSAFVDETLKPYLERVEGVASVSSIGLVEKSVQIDLNESKIEKTKNAVINQLKKSFDEAGEGLNEALTQAREAQNKLNAAEATIGAGATNALFDRINAPVTETAARLNAGVQNLLAILNQIDTEGNEAADVQLAEAVQNLENAQAAFQNNSFAAIMQGAAYLRQAFAQIEALLSRLQNLQDLTASDITQLREELTALSVQLDEVPAQMNALQEEAASSVQAQLSAVITYTQAILQVDSVVRELEKARAEYETARDNALSGEQLSALITATNLSSLIYAQNFAMPAGYIDDANDESWLLKVGEEYRSADEIADILLMDSDMTGSVRIRDVADVTVIDNSMDAYTMLNGNDGIVLSMYKSSAAGTNEVSSACKKSIEQIMAEYPGTHVVVLMDQGEYIDLLVSDILKSMLFGAVLAIIVLALFLRSIKPTLMVAVSIPLSVLFTLVLMYFTNLSMNIMTLSGVALGIGMLVDNSIVVMENIIRLRARGVSPGNASVQGARQVSGAIAASTLTTICVFVPMLFTTGTVRELLLPMALSITYCLAASLIAAVTVVPASASVLLKRGRTVDKTILDKVYNRYERGLHFCLDHKWLPLIASVAALGISITLLFRMGIIMVPEMSSGQIQVDIRTDKNLTREESYAVADEAMKRIMQTDGVIDVGIMDRASGTQLFSSFSASGAAYGSYMGYVTVDKNLPVATVTTICEDIDARLSDLPLTSDTATNGMSDMEFMFSSGLSVVVYGFDLNKMQEIAGRVADEIRTIEGFTNVKDGSARGEKTLILQIDKDKAIAKGITVAQVFAAITSQMKTEVTATAIEENDITMKVLITDNTQLLTKENLLDLEIEVSGQMQGMTQSGMSGLEGMQSGMGGMDFFSGAGGQTGEEPAENEEAGETAQDDTSSKVVLREIATLEEGVSPVSVNRKNLTRYVTVSADTMEGYNTTLLSRQLEEKLDAINKEIPNGYAVVMEGETLQVGEMIKQMTRMILMGFAFIYLVMVAQFQSFLSPFIIIFTIPLALTGGLLGLLVFGEQLSVLSLMGFLVLMGTVVNNGIVFVDYVNRLRVGGLSRRDALTAAGRTRMRPILMTALTTILAMGQLIFGRGIGAQMTKGMAVVIAGGLLYATLMTLFIIPVIYDIMFKKEPHNVQIDEDLDLLPDDAKEYLQSKGSRL